jgi:hypothetical protein
VRDVLQFDRHHITAVGAARALLAQRRTRDRIAAKTVRGVATSASWNVT